MKADLDTPEFLTESKNVAGTNWMETDRGTFLDHLTDKTAPPVRPKPLQK